jgi:hypothetical protein
LGLHEFTAKPGQVMRLCGERGRREENQELNHGAKVKMKGII